MRIRCARVERLVHRVAGLRILARAIQGPRQRRERREVSTQLDVLAGPLHRLRAVLPHVRIEINQMMIVVNAAALGCFQISSQGFLIPRLGAIRLAEKLVEFTERLLKFRPRHARNALFVKRGGFGKLP